MGGGISGRTIFERDILSSQRTPTGFRLSHIKRRTRPHDYYCGNRLSEENVRLHRPRRLLTVSVCFVYRTTRKLCASKPCNGLLNPANNLVARPYGYRQAFPGLQPQASGENLLQNCNTGVTTPCSPPLRLFRKVRIELSPLQGESLCEVTELLSPFALGSH
jgi:hypothetical protein